MPDDTPPPIPVRFIQSTKGSGGRKRQVSAKESGLRHDMSQFYSMKEVLERLFGHRLYAQLKETADFRGWQEALTRLLNAIELSIKSTVQIADDDWRGQIKETLEHGRKRLEVVQSMDELFSSASATLTEVVFLQIGMMPERSAKADKILKMEFLL